MRMLRLKLILLFRSLPNDDIKLRELLERFGLIERFTPYVSGGRGSIRSDEAREWLEKRRNEAIAEVTWRSQQSLCWLRQLPQYGARTGV
jgi:hypothetical protein